VQPDVWWGLLEGWFLEQIYITLMVLPAHIAIDFGDIATNPPLDNQFEVLTKALMDRISMSDNERIQQLLHIESVGDRRSSQLLRSMRRLARTLGMEDRLLKELFLHKIPRGIRMGLSEVPTTIDIENLSTMADRMLLHQTTTPSISTIVQHSSNSTMTPSNRELADQIALLTKK